MCVQLSKEIIFTQIAPSATPMTMKATAIFPLPTLTSATTFTITTHTTLWPMQLEGRRCAWFNPEAEESGAWQGESCRVWQAAEGHTKCMCRQEGMYAVIGQMVEPKVCNYLVVVYRA